MWNLKNETSKYNNNNNKKRCTVIENRLSKYILNEKKYIEFAEQMDIWRQICSTKGFPGGSW